MNQINESRWITCPVCGKKTHAKAYADTVLIRFPLYCPKCRAETMINVVQLKMIVSEEPDT